MFGDGTGACGVGADASVAAMEARKTSRKVDIFRIDSIKRWARRARVAHGGTAKAISFLGG